MRQSFLDKNRSIYSTNNESNVNVNLTQKARLFPYEAIQANIDRYELYNEERDASNNFRLIFTINSVCSNVLFNMRTEVVKNEGSVTDCSALVKDTDRANREGYAVNSSELTREQAIKDTEYSHPDIGKWVYHCGLDIFNNHRLRTNSFIYISKVKNVDNQSDTEHYNTLWDWKRDKNGDTVEEVLIDSPMNTPQKSHVYQLDNILTFQDAVQENLNVRNGWYGFVNTGSIEIPNGKLAGMSVNKIMNNNKACEIYNMYPDISLFSFIPKYNNFQRRKENNWDYCLTYPYLSDENLFKTINEGKDGILIIKSGTTTVNNEEYTWFTTKLPHNLSVGDYVRLYKDNGKDFIRVRVARVSDLNNENKKFLFMVNLKENTQNYKYFKKDANGLECRYYFRLFKKIKNLDGTDFKSDLSRLAFGENIYGDRMAQLMFLDTVNLDGLLDNLGRPLSEIYLTIVKRNKGWEKWYKQGVYMGPDIEFSHCFGPVTSGLDLPKEQTDYNVHKLHNYLNSNNSSKPKPLPKDEEGVNTEITIDDDFFYGDVIEFNPYTFEEATITDVYYRFNTAQRELDGLRYTAYNLVSDDYDSEGFKVENIKKSDGVEAILTAYKPEGYYYKPHYKIQVHNLQDTPNRFLAPVVKPLSGTVPTISTTGETGGTLSYVAGANTTIKHYASGDTIEALPIANQYNVFVNTDVSSGYTVQIYYGSVPQDADGDIQIKNIKITAATDYDYYPGDVFGICKYNTADTNEAKIYWGNVTMIESVEVEEEGEIKTYPVLTIDVENWPYDTISVDDEFALTDGTVPQYAVYNPLQQTFIWRDVIAPSETPSNASTHDIPFSNGAFYIHNNITFFLRRQDPFNEYGLQDDFDYTNYEREDGETLDDFKTRVNPNYLYNRMTKERQVATDLLKFVATDIINNCW